MRHIYYLSILLSIVASAVPVAAQQRSIFTTAPRLPGFINPAPAGMPGNTGSRAGIARGADPTLPVRLQSAIETTLAGVDVRARRGVQVSVIAPGLGLWTGVAGSSTASAPIDPAMRFQIGSITKTFVAATILQLREEGKLALDDSIGTWIAPHANIDGSVTVRQLLNHSSGIFDYVNDDPSQQLLADAYIYHPTKSWTPEELLAHVGPAIFKRGTNILYSNTNYLLLGMIVDSITGKSVASEIHRRFIEPLGLTSTYCGWEDSVGGEYAHGWCNGFDPNDSDAQADISPIPTTAGLSVARTAGGIVTTSEDLVRWTNALYNGTVLAKSTRDTMLTFKNSSMGAVGLGVFRWQYYSKLLYGHTGGILGYSSWTFSIPSDSISVTILINSYHSRADEGSNSLAIAILGEVYRQVSGVDNGAAMPGAKAMLSANYPNHFNNGTAINYTLRTGESTVARRMEMVR